MTDQTSPNFESDSPLAELWSAAGVDLREGLEDIPPPNLERIREGVQTSLAADLPVTGGGESGVVTASAGGVTALTAAKVASLLMALGAAVTWLQPDLSAPPSVPPPTPVARTEPVSAPRESVAPESPGITAEREATKLRNEAGPPPFVAARRQESPNSITAVAEPAHRAEAAAPPIAESRVEPDIPRRVASMNDALMALERARSAPSPEEQAALLEALLSDFADSQVAAPARVLLAEVYTQQRSWAKLEPLTAELLPQLAGTGEQGTDALKQRTWALVGLGRCHEAELIIQEVSDGQHDDLRVPDDDTDIERWRSRLTRSLGKEIRSCR